MRPTLESICILSLLAAGAMPGAGGEPFRTDINPALQYYQAFLLVLKPMSQTDRYYLESKEDRRWKLPERYGEIVAEYDIQFKLLRRAARSKAACDWGIDLSPGYETPFAHLSSAKRVAEAASLRARWELQHDQQAEARDDLLAAFTLGRNVSRDGRLISALVQVSIEDTVGCKSVAENFGRLSPETLKQLMDGFDAAPARGTVAGCIPLEKAESLGWVAAQLREMQKLPPGNNAAAFEALRRLYAEAEKTFLDWRDPGDDTKAVADLRQRIERFQAEAGPRGDETKALAALRQRYTGALHPDAVYQKLAVMTTCPYRDFENQVKACSAEVRKSGNPIVSQMTAPVAWETARRREFRILVHLAMTRAAVEYKLHGEAGFQGVADPCGQRPFLLRRFVFQGVDRGFQLTSAIAAANSKTMIFVEQDGDPFYVIGPQVGEACK